MDSENKPDHFRTVVGKGVYSLTETWHLKKSFLDLWFVRALDETAFSTCKFWDDAKSKIPLLPDTDKN